LSPLADDMFIEKVSTAKTQVPLGTATKLNLIIFFCGIFPQNAGWAKIF